MVDLAAPSLCARASTLGEVRLKYSISGGCARLLPIMGSYALLDLFDLHFLSQ